MPPFSPSHPSHSYGSWDHLERRAGGALLALGLFVALYMPLLWLDHALFESPEAGTVLRPSTGLLLVALWFSRPARWPVFMAVHAIASLLVGQWLEGPLDARAAGFAVLPGAVSAAMGALACRLLLRKPLDVQVSQVPVAMIGVVCGAACGAIVASALSVGIAPGAPRWFHSLASHTVEYSLGALSTGPVVLTWMQQLRYRIPELALRSRRELAWLTAWTLAPVILGWILLRGPNSSLLPVPLLAGPALVIASLRLPPRWAVCLAALFVLPFSLLAASREAPYSVADPAIRIGLQQMLAGIFVVVPFILSVGIAQLRITVASLARSEQRYRSFVQLSREAVWRLEVDPPMPVALSRAEQREWLRNHARIADSSPAHSRFDAQDAVGATDDWWESSPWGREFERRLEGCADGEFDVDGLIFRVARDGHQLTFVASMQAVVQSGTVLRFWGVARDVTELSDLNTRLLQNQQRLQAFSRRVVEAEERARRDTAVDLHDGIGQMLVGMQMMVDAVRQRSTSAVEPLLGELALRLRQVQDHTRRMITDLSPPGLYELGLQAALEWQAIQTWELEGLGVRLKCNVQEAAIPLETRVLVFRVVRELLRNVVRHSGVLTAQVEAHGDERTLRVKVSDSGRGFDGSWPGPATANCFGLWSIAERAREIGGRLDIDSLPDHGTRIELEIPLRAK